MGSNKGSSGSDKAKQRREQQESARQRKKAAKRGRKQEQQPPNFNMIEVTVRFVTKAERYHELQLAFQSLKYSTTLTTYIPKAKHDDWRQRAVGTRGFNITLPFELMKRVEREISQWWTRATEEELRISELPEVV